MDEDAKVECEEEVVVTAVQEEDTTAGVEACAIEVVTAAGEVEVAAVEVETADGEVETEEEATLEEDTVPVEVVDAVEEVTGEDLFMDLDLDLVKICILDVAMELAPEKK